MDNLRHWILTGALCLSAASLVGLSGCYHHHDDDYRDEHGWNHHGYYDEHHAWHGGYYDDTHTYHEDPGDWHH